MSLVTFVIGKGDLLEQVLCPFCGVPLQPDTQVILCPVEGTPHHLECWRRNGNHCSILGCSGQGEISVASNAVIDAPRGLFKSIGGVSSMFGQFGLGDLSNMPYGALVVYITESYKVGNTVTIHSLDNNGNKVQSYYANVVKRISEGDKTIYAAVFPRLPPGKYLIHESASFPDYISGKKTKVTVFEGAVSEAEFK